MTPSSRPFCTAPSLAVFASLLSSLCAVATAEVLTIDLPRPAAPAVETFAMGTAKNPAGTTLSLDARSLLRNGKPWTPVMGEFHFSRYHEADWREELLKMKAGGIDIVATYVFWNHHEETEDVFDWSGRLSLRQFILACRDVGLEVVVRCGPWCHGEVRNGGIPDWVLAKGWKVRSDDPAYLERVRALYQEIAAQTRGLLWKSGGPVVAVQLENEYGGPAEHLLTLKKIARDAGLDVPYYTRTGWPALKSPMPFGEILPLYGVYSEGFWDRELTAMPGNYWAGFHFSRLREDANIANEALGKREAKDGPDVSRYPYLTCEMGGGMMSAYHRRIRVYPADIESTALIKIGSGSNLPGYYMYHGGTNPNSGTGITLQENQSTQITNWNDMPVRGYDFQAPLGEYGQTRPHYHLLRRLHLFLRDFGSSLATMPSVLPDKRPAGRDDATTVRWSARSDGRSGFIFVNNYERLKNLPAKSNVQFSLKLPGSDSAFTIPSSPFTLPAGSRFIWPFNLDLGQGARLVHATAQLVCFVDDGDTRTLFFAETPGVDPEFLIQEGAHKTKLDSGKSSRDGSRLLIHKLKPSTDAFARIGDKSATVQLVLLSEEDSLALWKGTWQGRDRAILSRADVVIDNDQLRLVSSSVENLNAAVYPAPEKVTAGDAKISTKSDGLFRRFSAPAPEAFTSKVIAEKLKDAGPPRNVKPGKAPKPVAAAPEDSDFSEAAIWRIKFPDGLDEKVSPLLRIRYTGDVARFTLDGKLVTDDFYNGNVFEIGLKRLGRLTYAELRLSILPLPKDAPIHLPAEVKPVYNSIGAAINLDSVELIPRYSSTLTASGKK
ncbi:MAG: beta-galactosidase [Nibricoccus sp.]